MRFNPNYMTEDGVFDVDIDMESLTMETGSTNPYHWSENITDNAIQVYNNRTDKISFKSLYVSKGRLYFTGSLGKRQGTKRYFIDELKNIK